MRDKSITEFLSDTAEWGSVVGKLSRRKKLSLMSSVDQPPCSILREERYDQLGVGGVGNALIYESSSILYKFVP